MKHTAFKPFARSQAPKKFRQSLLSQLIFGALVFSNYSLHAIASESRPLEAPSVDIIGDTPLPGLGIARERISTQVLTASDEQLSRSHATQLAEFMNDQFASVSVNGVSGNPFQTDLAFRGFYASPLLGMPQGLAVYLDGMRMNEGFGDTVAWDLIPRNALAGVNLLAGSAPAFGLNALGGALTMGTKSGETHPGGEAELGVGSFGRQEMAISQGGSREGNSWFFAANDYRDAGWRDASPSSVGQFFAKLGHQTDEADLDVSFGMSTSTLAGNGLTPASFLADRWASIYTRKDETRNQAWFLNARLDRQLDRSTWLGSNVYYRVSRLRAVNPDLNSIQDDRYGVTSYEDGDPHAASINRQQLDQSTLGLNLQWTRQFAESNQITLGLAMEQGRADYKRSYQLGDFASDRSVTATGDETQIVDVTGHTRSTGVFAVWQQTLDERLHLNAAARYNVSTVRVVDHMPTDTIITGSHGLDADYRYQHFNPSLGLTWDWLPETTIYGNISESSRAPTPIELACADPNAACLLPNAMQSDPPLNQVITRSLEGGLRGRWGQGGRWNVGLFSATNRDDILFVATTAGGSGYFQNFGKTRRQGLELGLNQETDRWTWAASYSLIDATFQSSTQIMSPTNVTADGSGNIQVNAGDRLPGIPRHQLKASLEWHPADAYRLGAQWVAFSSQYAHGNENNRDPSGIIPGYGLLNLYGQAKLNGTWQIHGRINNLFDRRYSTGGQLASNAFAGGSFQSNTADWSKESFLAPGAPRTLYVGVKMSF